MNIKKLRQEYKITQSEFAKHLGVAQNTVSMWENNNRTPRADKLPEIAKVLKCEISDLFDTKKA